MAILARCERAQTSQPVVQSGVQVTVLRWDDRIDVELIEYGRDLAELDYHVDELPRLAIGPAVAAAIERLTAFAGAGGEGGGR